MSIEAGLRTYLLSLAGLNGLVAKNVFDGEAPEGTSLPYVVCLRATSNRPLDMSGATGMAQVVIDLHCIGSTYKQAKDVAAAITPAAAPNGSGGVNGFGPGAMGGVQVEGCFVGDEKDPDPILSAELAALKRFATIVPVELWYLE